MGVGRVDELFAGTAPQGLGPASEEPRVGLVHLDDATVEVIAGDRQRGGVEDGPEVPLGGRQRGVQAGGLKRRRELRRQQ